MIILFYYMNKNRLVIYTKSVKSTDNFKKGLAFWCIKVMPKQEYMLALIATKSVLRAFEPHD